MKTAFIVWYLVITSSSGGTAVVPIPYTSKEDCMGAAVLFTKERQEGKGPYSWGNCVPQSQIKEKDLK